MTTIVQLEKVGLRHATGIAPATGGIGGAADGTAILSDLSVALQAGSFHLLVGPGGAGKTALLELLGLVRRPDSGTFHLLGEEVGALPRDRLPALRRRIGTIHRDGRLLPHLSVAANVALPLHLAGHAAAATEPAVAAMLRRVGLAERAVALPATLSAGERQRAAIARAAIAQPALILADEPTGDVDAATADRLLVLLASLATAESTVVMATHDPRLFTRLPTARMLRLERGRLHDPAARAVAGMPA